MCYGLIHQSTAGTTPEIIIEPVVVEEVKTFDTEIVRLSKKYSLNEQLLRKVIFCESTVYAYATGTKAVVGEDIGYMQINTYFHEATATKMGLNIYDWQDNLEYGTWLMSREGTTPWNASRHCWSE